MRGKPKKKPNRYNPNRPSYAAVHRPVFRFRVSSLGEGALYAAMVGLFLKMSRKR